MDPVQVAIAVFTAITGLGAVLSAISARRSRLDAHRIYELQPKRDVLRRFVGNLHFATSDLRDHPQRVNLTAAMNEAVVVFGEDNDVVDKLQMFKRNLGNAANYPPLIRAMAEASDLSIGEFDNDFLMRPFTN